MKKIKVSIQDENTLILLEDASKGDLIDLKSIHETDIDKTSIISIINTIRQDKFQEKLKEKTDILNREYELQQKLKEKEWQENELKKLQEKDKEINELRIKYSNVETEKKLAITEAKSEIEKERDRLANELKNKEIEKQLLEKTLNEGFSEKIKSKDEIIKFKDEEIVRVKDMKAKLSTKMLGETLEQHCETEFNKLRATAFPKAYFEKDNDSKS